MTTTRSSSSSSSSSASPGIINMAEPLQAMQGFGGLLQQEKHRPAEACSPDSSFFSKINSHRTAMSSATSSPRTPTAHADRQCRCASEPSNEDGHS
jgi:hypothetical protein